MRNKKVNKNTQQTNVLLPKLDKKAISAFLKANPSIDLRKLNTFNSKQMDALNWQQQERATLLPQLKALQRLVRLTDELKAAIDLYEKGLHAAVQIASIPQHKFIKQYASVFTAKELSSEEQAKQVHQRALAHKSQALLTYTALVQHQSPHYRATRFDNLSGPTDTNYNNLPSYQDLFGDLDFCSCPECRSIYSPAAYFVDLMRVQDTYIEKMENVTPPAQLLKDRRPDLWEIPLDCEHTNTLVSKLQIVNEVLLKTLGKGASYEQLATINYPFNLPFNLSLAQIHVYLGQNKQSLARIWEMLDPTADKAVESAIARQTLELSLEQWKLYSTPNTDWDTLAPLYGLDPKKDPMSKLDEINIFLLQTGLSYVQLQELVYEDLSQAEIDKNLNKDFFINIDTTSGKTIPPIGIDSDKGQLTNLTLERLDHINRFVRLAQALSWSFTDLDWVLRTLHVTVSALSKNATDINDNILPYLAWIQTLAQQYKLSINQTSALIGIFKDFGKKNGPTFFDQVFNNAYVPNPPSWTNKEGQYDLIWNVPQADNTTLPFTQDIQIQNALTAALQISQDDLLRISYLVLKGLGINDSKLPLTLSNLSILYRLSQLPILTGLNIQECLIALGLPGQPAEALLNLVSAKESLAQGSLVLLQKFAQWLQTTSFSVYQLQFVLTGTSQDPTIQNQLLGNDKITNFLNGLRAAIELTLLTEKQFTTILYPTLQSILGNQAEVVSNQIYKRLQDKAVNYIDNQGVVTEKGATVTIGQLEDVLKDILSNLPKNLLDEILNLIINTLQNSFQIQQTTLTQQLASLYNVSPNLVHALEVWGGLTLEDLEGSQVIKSKRPNPYAAAPLLQSLVAKPAKRSAKTTLSLTENPDVIERLQLLQQYAVLLQSLALSPAEVQAMIDNPGYFGISYVSAKGVPSFQFTLANIQTLYYFKQLIQSFQDTENHLLDYFGVANTSQQLEEVAQKLAQFTQWDAGQIQFLLKQLWLVNKNNKKVKKTNSLPVIPVYATVAGVRQLAAYFRLAQQLNIDMATLWQLNNASDSRTGYVTYESLSAALWAGLQKQYQGQSSQLNSLQSTLDETKRSALLDLVIYQLRTQKDLPIKTARDLYEYLLIDVEVSGSAQISYIKEAISAVQLYIYRCFNSLEPGIKIYPELNAWWEWLDSYRVWQANREVFLYPENYIQPELRKSKTPQFVELENDLQQNKLTTDVVETAARAYLDKFAQVATLKIVGSYLYANDEGNLLSDQTLYLVGRTNTKAYTYYYRSATLVFDAINQTYVATYWSPWIQVDLQINSTLATPVYAFNRLFLLWAETKPSTSGNDANKKTFEATLYYAFYDFNKRWSAPQPLMDPITLPDSVTTQIEAEALVWQQVRAVFSTEKQLLYWAWGDKESDNFCTGTINKQFVVQVEPRHLQLTNLSITNSPNAVVYKGKLYTFYTDGAGPAYAVLENGQWRLQRINPNEVGVSGNFNLVEHQNNLYCFHQGKNNDHGLWYFILQEGNNQKDYRIGSSKLSGSPSVVSFSNALHCFYREADPSDKQPGTALYYLFSLESQYIDIVPDVYMSGSPSVVAFQNLVYCFYQHSSNDGTLWYVAAGTETAWSSPQQVLPNSLYISGNPSAVVFQNKLYCFYQSKNNPGELWYAVRDGKGNWENIQVLGANIFGDPSAVVYEGNLYCFYQGRKSANEGDGKIWYSMLWPVGNRVLSFLGFVKDPKQTLPLQVVPGIELTWSINVGPDRTQFLCIPNQTPIRLNSMVVYELNQILFSQGIDIFLSLDTQKTPEIKIDGTKTNTLDFSGANSLYYWELFFHMPLLVAHSLSTQQQFELAKKWYEYIFNPTMNKQFVNLVDKDNPNDKYWQFLMLRAQYNPTLQTELDETWAEEVQYDLKDPAQLAAYHDDPFDPHAIARLRPIAYQKTLVMHYIDNLLNWGDNLFRQYTIETLVEATLLYVMAYDLLGKQPVSLGPCPLPAAEDLEEIAKHYDNSLAKIPEFLINVEQIQTSVVVANVQDTPHNYIPGDYFGLPENEQFVAYWDKVKQRLYNIRHNLNIDGVYQQLPLFEPRINPMQLVQAVASGEGVGQALAGNQVDVPYYRFNVMIAKAQSLTQTVIQLGQSLLTVLEKQDAEQLSLLYNTNQQNLLALTRASKEDQLEAATQTVASLQASLKNAQDRYNYYTQLLNKGLLSGEQTQLSLETTSIILQGIAQGIKGISIAGYLIPTIYGVAVGGMEPGSAIVQGASILEGTAGVLNTAAGLAGTIASYQRRTEDWQLQQTLAQDDINQVQFQIVAAQYQQSMASEDIKLLEKQIEQEQAVQAFLKNKFTRAQLYQWMVGKLSALYFQTYQVAYNVAIQAEKAWQFERCNQQSFIHPTYWDDLYHGLIAGEALQLDLQRMEKTYMDQDERKLEMVKIISLAQLDPQAFQNLKTTGVCTFDIAEKDFDYDFPGHYCRQIKSISISFPALLGPYQNVHATLTQTGNKTLLQPDANGVKYLLGKSETQPDGSILRVDMRANQQVALTQGLNDDGLFVINFDDPRYLPFEGTGAVSSWRLNMPKAYNAVDFESITDVIVTLQYTAFSGDESFQTIVEENLGAFNGYQSLVMGQEYSSAWYSFIQQAQPLVFTVSPALFRPNLRNYKVSAIVLMLELTPAGEGISDMPTLTLTYGQGTTQDFVFKKNPSTGNVSASVTGLAVPVSNAAQWELVIKSDTGKLMTAANANNMVVVLQYTADFS